MALATVLRISPGLAHATSAPCRRPRDEIADDLLEEEAPWAVTIAQRSWRALSSQAGVARLTARTPPTSTWRRKRCCSTAERALERISTFLEGSSVIERRHWLGSRLIRLLPPRCSQWPARSGRPQRTTALAAPRMSVANFRRPRWNTGARTTACRNRAVERVLGLHSVADSDEFLERQERPGSDHGATCGAFINAEFGVRGPGSHEGSDRTTLHPAPSGEVPG